MDDINPYLPDEKRALIKDQLLSWRNEGLFTPPTLRGTVQMPGDQGGSNWGTTAANPTNGTVYVLGVDAPAVIRLAKSAPGIPAPNDAFGPQGNRGGGGGGRGALKRLREGLYIPQNCQVCHGADLKGGAGPSLVDITLKMGMDAVRAIVQGGKGAMPSFSNLTPADMDDIMAFLTIRRRHAAGGGRAAAAGEAGHRTTLSLGGPSWRPVRLRLGCGVGAAGAPAG